MVLNFGFVIIVVCDVMKIDIFFLVYCLVMCIGFVYNEVFVDFCEVIFFYIFGWDEFIYESYVVVF